MKRKYGSQTSVSLDIFCFFGFNLYMRGLFFIAVGILLCCSFLYAENSAVRDLPDSYTPGGTFNVTINITVNPGTPVTGLIVTESLPPGWSVINADPYWSKYIATTNSYKWLYFFQFPVYGNFPITYTVKVPSDASGSYNFSGTINDGYSTRDITGDTVINQYSQVSPPVFSPQPQTFLQLLSGYRNFL